MKKSKKIKEGFHNNTISELEKRLAGPNRIILREHEYRNGGDHEADLILINKHQNYAYAIEVKTANTTKACKKAYWQLRADKKYIKERIKVDRIFMFYAYRSGNNYTIKRVMS